MFLVLELWEFLGLISKFGTEQHALAACHSFQIRAPKPLACRPFEASGPNPWARVRARARALWPMSTEPGKEPTDQSVGHTGRSSKPELACGRFGSPVWFLGDIPLLCIITALCSLKRRHPPQYDCIKIPLTLLPFCWSSSGKSHAKKAFALFVCKYTT